MPLIVPLNTEQLMPCGHGTRFLYCGDEGTNHCEECARIAELEAEAEKLKAEQCENMELMAESVSVEAFATKVIVRLKQERDEARREIEELREELAVLKHGK